MVKRVFECIQGDPEFRRLLKCREFKGADTYLRARGVDLNITQLPQFYENRELRLPDEAKIRDYPLLKDWKESYQWISARANHTALGMEAHLQPSGLKAWRARQAQWLHDIKGGKRPLSVVVAFELSQGCSVGCSFCAFSAPKLTRIFESSSSNLKLWKNILEASVNFFGGPMMSCCYHATEPADNPGYPEFIKRFYEILGYVPQTTTAAPLRNNAWTKAVMELRKLSPVFFDRFSVHSPDDLAKVHKKFSPHELAKTPMVMLGQEALTQPVSSGKARCSGTEAETIECTCGFIVNMCSQTIEIVVPCVASGQNPNGYILLAREKFSSPKEFEDKLENLCDTHIPVSLPEQLQFRSHLSYRELADGFVLGSPSRQYRLTGDHIYRKSGSILSEGGCSPCEFMGSMQASGYSPVRSLALLNRLFTSGVFKETYLYER